ncbi:MAG: TIGR02757 family protein [Bacteroidales bacterium]|nr:TIGR02757 family protein [Bacteroidales bacterium]MBN2763610.1 TIGR02757 family protein [Bacteroidales bacterium]
MKHDLNFIKDFLEEKTSFYNRSDFIASDPISVPHSFTHTRDIEIAAFLTATMAWGQRKTIINKAFQLLGLMNNHPYDFICRLGPEEEKQLAYFCHRTFNGTDAVCFMRSLKNILLQFGSLQDLFEGLYLKDRNIRDTLIHFREVFFAPSYPARTAKHIADVSKGSTAKRLNMFLRWMVRHDNRGVDFGHWRKIPPSALYIPLDVHSSAVARRLGLLQRKQNDWQAVEELTAVLRKFDRDDPVKYDFALFSLGVDNDLMI